MSPRETRGAKRRTTTRPSPKPKARTADRFARAADAFRRLCEVMATLRAPGGCPWDAEQSFESLKPYLIEEAFETLAAMESRDAAEHCEELGDLLLQIVFQAEIAQETELFDVAAVADGIRTKLIRRHPHVFGEDGKGAPKRERTAAAALDRWEKIKRDEKPLDTSALAGVPKGMPALLRAQRTGEKAAAAGFDWTEAQGALDKVAEEVGELRQALAAAEGVDAQREEVGDLLFAVTSLCRHLKIDAESALRTAVDKFTGRFRYVEEKLAAEGRAPHHVGMDILDRLWNEAKRQPLMSRSASGTVRPDSAEVPRRAADSDEPGISS